MHTSHDYNSLFNRTAFRSVSIGYVTSHVKDRNKKVLLQVLTMLLCLMGGEGGGGYPIKSWWWWWGTSPHHPDLARGVLPPSRPGWLGGVPQIPPPPSRPGRPQVPPTIQTWDGVSPHPDQGWGTPHSQTCDGVPLPPTDLGQGNPHPPQVWTDWKYYLPPSFGCGR